MEHIPAIARGELLDDLIFSRDQLRRDSRILRLLGVRSRSCSQQGRIDPLVERLYGSDSYQGIVDLDAAWGY